MKIAKLKSLLIALAVFTLLVTFAVRIAGSAGLAAAIVTFLVGDFLVTPALFHVPRTRCYSGTFIVPILTGYIAEAFRSYIPELSFFSQDFGKSGAGDTAIFAPPVKFGQEVISKVALPPVSDLFLPGDGMGSNSQNVKTLVQDVAVRINKARKITLVLPAGDAAQYVLDGAFKKSVIEAARTLGRDIVGDAILEANSQNFSQAKTCTKAAADRTVLRDVRKAMNLITRVPERFMLGNTDFVAAIADDPQVRSSQFNNQRVDADPFISLVNLEGFQEIREFPNMPDGNVALAAFTANAGTDYITFAGTTLSGPKYSPLKNGDRVRVSSDTTLPAGLAANTDYNVINIDVANNKCQLSLTAGGAAIDITDAGAGIHSATRFEALNAFAFEKRAIHIASRQLEDSLDLARQLGVPVNLLPVAYVDPETGLSVVAYMWTDTSGTNPTGNLYCTLIVAYGIIAGRGAAINANDAGPAATFAAGRGFDYAGYRVVETAHS